MYHHSSTAPFSLLLCLSLALLVLASTEDPAMETTITTMTTMRTTMTTTEPTTTNNRSISCPGDLSPPCMGERPPLAESGCCPAGAWQTCQPSRGLSCDNELGLFCRDERGVAVHHSRGKCKGDFELNVTSRGETVLDLEWLNFAPADYLFEYVILYRENTYHADISQWNIRDIGNSPKCSLAKLKPATVYFIRVAIWENARAGILGKMTEAVSVKTRQSEFCYHLDEFYEVGEHVINHCEENCTCLATGEFQCVPLCEVQGLPDVEEGCHIIPGEKCCDFKVSCMVGGVSCIMDDVTYPHGSEFDHNCKQCTCSHGQVECHFPEECKEMEASPECPRPTRVEVEGQCCPQWRCSELDDDACHYEQQRFEKGEYFSSENCGLCQCHGTDGVHCPPECPPVVLMQPSLECPDPEIRKEGCCDTIHCNYANLSLPQLIGRMFARSYSPVTLTVSFEASPQPEESEVPLYGQYEILFANTSDHQLSWHQRLVQPVDVRLQQDRPKRESSTSAAPIDALTKDNAIVVDNRVYITLAGVDPDTTYYVKVKPLTTGVPSNPNSMMDVAAPHAGAASTNTLVVKTMPLDNVESCFYEGKQLLHGELAKQTCNESCLCTLGQVVCVSTCKAEQVVMARSHSCPEPRLEKVPGSCCPEWKCYPSVTGCLYNDMTLSSGQSVRRACDVCTCRNGTYTCTSQCQDVQIPPRPGCTLTNVTGQCCPQWTCPIESHPPFGVKTSINVLLDAHCPKETSKFKPDLEEDLAHQVTPVCIENQSPALANYCNNLQIKVKCGPHSHVNLMSSKSRFRRETQSASSPDVHKVLEGSEVGDTIEVQIFLSANFSLESPADLTVELLQSAALQLVTRLNQSLNVRLPGGETAGVSRISSIPQISYICESGFAYEKGRCVLSNVETSVVSRIKMDMEASDITDSLAVLTWQRPNERTLSQISHFMVEHRRSGELDWIPSDLLEPRRATYLLRSLEAGQVYTVRLMASVVWPEQSRWVMAELQVQTLRHSELQTGPRLSITKVAVSEDYAFVMWDQIPEKLATNILSLEVKWRKSSSSVYTFSQKLQDKHQNFAYLQGLKEDTAYTAEVRILLKSGSIVTSGLIQFVTKSRENKFVELLVVVCVSSALSFLVAGMVAIVIIQWRRRKAEKSAGGFVNHTFGVQLNSKKEIDPAANQGVI